MNSPKEIANNYIGIGKGKVNTPVAKMFVLGILEVNCSQVIVFLLFRSAKKRSLLAEC